MTVLYHAREGKREVHDRKNAAGSAIYIGNKNERNIHKFPLVL